MNDQHHDADDFWGPKGDWTPSRSAPRPTPRTDRRTGLAGRLRTGMSSVLDLGADATREHRRVDATAGRRPVDPADQVDPTPVLPQRDLLDGWPDDDDVAAYEAAPRRRTSPAAPPPPMADGDHDDLAYGHDDRAYSGLSDLADDEPHVGAIAPAPGAAAATAAGRPVGGRRHHGAGGRGSDAGAGGGGTQWGAGWEPVGRGGRPPGAVDPRLARFGVVAVVVTLLVPVVLGLRSDDGAGEVATEQNPSTTAAPEATGSTAPAVTVVVADGTAPPGRATAGSRSGSGGSGAGSAGASASADADADGATADAGSESASAEADPEPAVTAAACAQEYEVVSGDYWLRLAEGAGVALSDLLAVNGATAETAIYPGSTICLPAGASTPPPPPAPTTAAPATASASPSNDSSSSGSSSGATTAAPTTAAPTTPAPTEPPATEPPATQPPATDPPETDPPATQPPSPVGPGAVQQLIRDIWPDRLEERALQIADRESNFVPTAKNYCCYGVFQIYWEVHKGWLADMGVTSDQQLFDAETNIRAALQLYRRSGGWGPWGF